MSKSNDQPVTVREAQDGAPGFKIPRPPETINVYLNQQIDANRRAWFEAESDAITMQTNVEELEGTPVTFYGETAEQALASLIGHLKAKGKSGKIRLVNKNKIDRTKLAALI